jgi:hypothetical protein
MLCSFASFDLRAGVAESVVAVEAALRFDDYKVLVLSIILDWKYMYTILSSWRRFLKELTRV